LWFDNDFWSCENDITIENTIEMLNDETFINETWIFFVFSGPSGRAVRRAVGGGRRQRRRRHCGAAAAVAPSSTPDPSTWSWPCSLTETFSGTWPSISRATLNGRSPE